VLIKNKHTHSFLVGKDLMKYNYEKNDFEHNSSDSNDAKILCVCFNGKTHTSFDDEIDFAKEKDDATRANMRSIGVLIQVDNFKILTCGDVTTKVEKGICESVYLRKKG